MTVFQLVEYFKVVSAQDSRIKGFYFGNLDYFNSQDNKQYPCVWVELPLDYENNNASNETITCYLNVMDRHSAYDTTAPVEVNPTPNSTNVTVINETVAGLSTTQQILSDYMTILLQTPNNVSPPAPQLIQNYNYNSFIKSYNDNLLGWRCTFSLVTAKNTCEISVNWPQINNVLTSSAVTPPTPPVVFCDTAPAGYDYGGFKVNISATGGTFTVITSQQSDPGGPYPFTDLNTLASTLFANSFIYYYSVVGNELTVWFNSNINYFQSGLLPDTGQTIEVLMEGNVESQIIEQLKFCQPAKTFCQNMPAFLNYGGFIAQIDFNGGTADMAASSETPPVGPPYNYTNIEDLAAARFGDLNTYVYAIGDPWTENTNTLFVNYNNTILNTIPDICASSWEVFTDGTSSSTFLVSAPCCN